MFQKRNAAIFLVAIVAIAVMIWRSSNRPSGGDVASAAPTRVDTADTDTGDLTMGAVLDMAIAAREHMSQHLDDYTARFVKQEVDQSGVLGGVTEMRVRIQTRLRGETEEAPKRVYLSFQAPEEVKGREVLWGEDLYDGKMAVHEVGLLLSLKTIWLDPTGVIAMNGQRYPISEIGIVSLVEKLIERGEKDRDNPDISVTLTDGHQHGQQTAQLIQVRRAKPSNEEDDFSLAEIVIDTDRQLILAYRSFGWAANPGDESPLLESYSYFDVETNVGLSDADFDYKNPEYSFPSF